MENALFVGERCYVRPYLVSDAEAMALEANNTNVSKYMTIGFPAPYTLDHAHGWINLSNSATPTTDFAIVKRDGALVGSIGLKVRTDIEARTMELGYWIGEAHWGQGLATEVVRGFTRWAFESKPELLRLEAGVFEGNEGSIRVLTKSGYTLEGLRRNAACKNGKVFGIHMLSILREECLGAEA